MNLTIKGILKSAYALVMKDPKTIAKYVILLLLIIIGHNFLSVYYGFADENQEIAEIAIAQHPIIFWVSLAVYLLLITLMSIAFLRAFNDVYEGNEQKSFTRNIQGGLPILLPVLIAGSLYSLATVVGMFLFLVPGILILLWFVFGTYEMILQNQHAIAAFKKSKEMTKGRLSEVFFYLFLPIIIVVLTLGLAGIVLSVGPMILLAFFDAGIIALLIRTFFVLVNIGIALFLIPMNVAIAIIVYHQFRKPRGPEKPLTPST